MGHPGWCKDKGLFSYIFVYNLQPYELNLFMFEIQIIIIVNLNDRSVLHLLLCALIKLNVKCFMPIMKE